MADGAQTADLVIFHYHLLPGGVTSVIRHAVKSLKERSKTISRIRVVAGEVPGDLTDIEEAPVTCLPDIAYCDAKPLARARLAKRAGRLAGVLSERFGDCLWWVHNYHLGKNPVFTQALLGLASGRDGPRMILQPHDFPEAGRFPALATLDRVLSLPLYPLGPGVRYAVINRRDAAVLADAGIADDRLFLLDDPVSPPVEGSSWVDDRRALRTLLFPGADSHAPVLLYPVRSIRRKNVLEAAILPWLLDGPCRLVVTLPGVSEHERGYSELVEEAFRSGLVPGEFATGVRRPDLGLAQLAAASDMVVSSSVQEGFGYLFVQALQWGLPLFARSLETSPGPPSLYDGYPAYFYDALLCPLEKSDRSELLERYHRKLRGLRKHLPPGAPEKIGEELSRLLGEDAVDMSYVDAPTQKRLLQNAASEPSFRQALRTLNPGPSGRLGSLLAERPAPRAAAVEERFGAAAFAARFDELVTSFERPPGAVTTSDPGEVQTRVRAAFAQAQYMRLLYD